MSICCKLVFGDQPLRTGSLYDDLCNGYEENHGITSGLGWEAKNASVHIVSTFIHGSDKSADGRSTTTHILI